MAGIRLKVLVAAAASLFAGTAAAQAAGVVISQFRVDGPLGGNDEFIELLNTTAAPIAIGGWQLQGCAAGSGAASTRATIPAGTTLASGQYFLLTNSAANGYSGPVPGNQTYATGFANNGNSGIRLVNGTTPVDGVGLGIGVCVEGAALAGLTTTEPNRAFMRLDSGIRDSNSNAADFGAPGASNPHNLASPPLNLGGGGGQPSVSLALSSASFGENGGTTTVTATLSAAASGPVTVSLAFAGSAERDVDYSASTISLIIPAGGLSASSILSGIDDLVFEGDESAAVSIASVSGADIGLPSSVTATLLDNETPSPPMIGARTYQIQGLAHRSAMTGQDVSNVPGIVTARASNGFYLQDADGDGNPNTSDAIFVFTSSAPPAAAAVGSQVLVSGRVSEFVPGGAASGNLSITQLGAPNLAVTAASGLFVNTAIAPVTLGNGGRVPPNLVIDNDTAGSVNDPAQTLYDPAEDGIDFHESVEGMLVRVDNAQVVGATNSFGEIFVVGDNGANASSLNPRGGISLVEIEPGRVDYNPERIQLQGGLNGISLPAADVADRIPSAVGVVSYAFGNSEILLTQPIEVIDGGLQPAVRTIDAGGDRLTVASYNVLNLDPGDNTFAAFASQIVNALGSPDIVALAEVQDNSGPTNNGVVAADLTLQLLADAIVAAGGPNYQFVEVHPQNNQDGGEPGGNIRVAQLYNPARVSFVPGTVGDGDALAATSTVLVNGELRLTLSPGRIEPMNSAWDSSRKPLAVSYRFNDSNVIVVNNHFNSKGGDQPLFGSSQPPSLSSEAQRRMQAELVHSFVRNALAQDPEAKIVVTGDLNDFGFSPPLRILENGVDGAQPALVNLTEALVPNPTERYSFVFQGNSQELDHTLVTPALFAAEAQFESLHVNVEFANFISDHDPQIASFRIVADDASPDAFAFAPVVDVAVDALVESNEITVSGINVPTAITVAGGEISINGGSYVAMFGLLVNDGDRVRVRVRAAGAFATAASTTVGIGDQSATFTVTTVAADSTPNAFTFGSVGAARFNSVHVSPPVTVGGINTAAPISVGGGAQYSINGGTFTSLPGTVRPGDAVRLRGQADNRFNSTTVFTATIGGITGRFEITTRKLLQRAQD
jgi:predicted extracellular nuclease